MTESGPILEVEGLVSCYGPTEVLHGIDLHVMRGEIVTVLGANGAGKSTLLRCISGVQPVRSGTIRFLGQDLKTVPDYGRAKIGIAHAPEGRQIFEELTVEQNLHLGAYSRRDDFSGEMTHVFELFPILKTKRNEVAGGLSGGQQQMLAIGRAIMAKPQVVIFDEPSMGLAPVLVDQVLDVITTLRDGGATLLIVEQNAFAALSIADRGYVIEQGRIVLSDDAQSLLANPEMRAAYLG